MNIQDLIGELAYYAEIFGDDTEVRIAAQQSWPFENEIRGLICSSPYPALSDYERNGVPVVWLLEGRQIGYFEKQAWELA